MERKLPAVTQFKSYRISLNNIKKEEKWFREQLKINNVSENTIESYCWTLRNYLKLYDGVVSAENLLAYKIRLIDTVSPASVNCRIHGINKYMNAKGIDFHLKTVKVEQKQYIENVISKQDYKHLKRMLKRNNKLYYFLVTGIATTGARISEMLTLKVEHVYDGLFPLYGKGTKHRTLFLTATYQKECIAWLKEIGREDGFVFSADGVTPINSNNARGMFGKLGKKYNIPANVMHPHGFRHLFGKLYMQNGGDIVTLASIMGHSSIETTKRYLLVSLEEARSQFNRIVNW